MDCFLPYTKSTVLRPSPFPVTSAINYSAQSLRTPLISTFSSTVFFFGDRRFARPFTIIDRNNRKALIVVASAGPSHCEHSSLNAPLEPKSPAGKYLSGVLQNDRENFPVAVDEQLAQMADDREEALARMNLSIDCSEALLHKRIAELKDHEYQAAVEDIIYMSIFYKFSEIGVPLVPRLSRCVYNGRLEIQPSRDFELESIHGLETMEIVREYLTKVVGWKPNSNVTENWATTEIGRLHLCNIYLASTSYGYFLKSASLRHQLEHCLAQVNYDLGVNYNTDIPLFGAWSRGLKDVSFGHISGVRSTSVGEVSSFKPGKKQEKKLRGYVKGFDVKAMQICAKPKSKEVKNLIERHSRALFGGGKTGALEVDELISTSRASLKRLVLEAIAFGSFLWDIEEHVDSVYKLKEN